MRAPKHRFRIVKPGCPMCAAPGETLSTHTTINAATKERDRLYNWVGLPEPLWIQQWDVHGQSWQRPDQLM